MRVDNGPLRRAFVAGDHDIAFICREMGWVRRRGRGTVPDHTTLRRRLGIRHNTNRLGRVEQTTIDYEEAERLADLMGLDPRDAGI